MHSSRIAALLGFLLTMPVLAQIEIPANPTVTPKKFTTRSVGGGVDPGVSVDSTKTAGANLRHVTHIVLHDSRLWTSADGRPLEAKLIAFEDLVVEAPQGSAQPVMPAPPANPTVTRDGKVRLLANKKPVEIALEKLSQADRELIEGIKAALAKKAAAGR
ncbi:MAG: hypothetical protein V4584_16730 [Verrucomicrobiota bacterium]